MNDLTTAQVVAPLCFMCDENCDHPRLGRFYTTQRNGKTGIVVGIVPMVNKSGESYAKIAYVEAWVIGKEKDTYYTHLDVKWSTWVPAYRLAKESV